MHVLRATPWLRKYKRPSKSFKRINTCKAPRHDGIPGQALKVCADHLAYVFTDIFNISLLQSVVPTCFNKTTIVLPGQQHPSQCQKNKGADCGLQEVTGRRTPSPSMGRQWRESAASGSSGFIEKTWHGLTTQTPSQRQRNRGSSSSAGCGGSVWTPKFSATSTGAPSRVSWLAASPPGMAVVPPSIHKALPAVPHHQGQEQLHPSGHRTAELLNSQSHYFHFTSYCYYWLLAVYIPVTCLHFRLYIVYISVYIVYISAYIYLYVYLYYRLYLHFVTPAYLPQQYYISIYILFYIFIFYLNVLHFVLYTIFYSYTVNFALFYILCFKFSFYLCDFLDTYFRTLLEGARDLRISLPTTASM